MSKKSMIIAGVVALVVVGLAGVLFLMPHNNPNKPATITTGTGPSTTSASASSTATSTTATTTSTTQNGDLPNGSSTSGGTSGSSTTANNSSASTDKLRVYPPLPEPTVAPASITQPLAAGKPLPRLSPNPKDVISGLKLGAVAEGTTYDIVMRPLGFGPDLLYGSRIVILIDSATPMGNAPAKNSLAKSLVLVLVDTTHRGTVTKGGTYEATITWLSDGTKLLPVLRVAALKK